jgi:hypothetical protein
MFILRGFLRNPVTFSLLRPSIALCKLISKSFNLRFPLKLRHPYTKSKDFNATWNCLFILILPRHVSAAMGHHQVLLLKLSHCNFYIICSFWCAYLFIYKCNRMLKYNIETPSFTAIQNTGTIIILRILIFTFLDLRWKAKTSNSIVVSVLWI